MNKKLIFVFIFSFIFLFLSYVPNIYEASLTNTLPKDRIMLWGEHIYTYDYNVYLSKIRQGEEGRWTVVDKYDNQINQKGVFFQMIYLLSGKIGGLFHFSSVLTFHLLRTVLSCLWVLTIILINIYFLKKPFLYILGIIICLLASSLPVFTKMGTEFWIGRYLGWWYEMDVLRRISYLPHYTLNYIILAILSVLMTIYAKTKQKKYFLIINILLFFSFFIHPSSGVIFLISWIFFQLIKLSWSKNKNLIPLIKEILILSLTTSVPLFYIQLTTSGYPWKSLIDFDKNNRLIFSLKEYLLALGPVVFTGFLGVFLVLKRKQKDLLSLVTWILAAFFCLIIFKFIPFQSELRFIQTANHIPLAILTVYFFYEMNKLTKKILLKLILFGYIALVLILGVVQTIYSIKDQTLFIYHKAVATLPLVPYPSQVMYPLADFYTGLKWLEKNTNRTDVVLSEITAGNYIPAYSGNFVYFGHFGETPHHQQRWQNVKLFFSGNLTDKDAYQFLINENVNYIFYGPQEKEYNQDDIGRYNFLKPVFQTPIVIIYKVN